MMDRSFNEEGAQVVEHILPSTSIPVVFAAAVAGQRSVGVHILEDRAPAATVVLQLVMKTNRSVVHTCTPYLVDAPCVAVLPALLSDLLARACIVSDT
jgi:hypothetical protein